MVAGLAYFLTIGILLVGLTLIFIHRHHARKSHAAGFCYVADCILAIMAFKRAPLVSMSSQGTPIPPRKPRVMYLDLDLHFSDAVSEAFSSKNPSGSPQILVSVYGLSRPS